MSSHQPRIFDSSWPAVVRVKSRIEAGYPSTGRLPGPASRLSGASAMAMCIPFAPEPAPTGRHIELSEHQATGPLPLGFDFEFFGTRYDFFEISSDGFVSFGTSVPRAWRDLHTRGRFLSPNEDLESFISLGWPDAAPLGRRLIAFEVRGAAQRRKLVLSFTWIPVSPEADPPPMAVQLSLHERTGMIEIHTARSDPALQRVSQAAVRFTTTRRSVDDRTA